jgi:hypothetical protein
MSDKILEQWINIKFCARVGKSASEMLALLTLALRKSSIFERHRRFYVGQEDMRDGPRSEQPKMYRVRTLVCYE